MASRKTIAAAAMTAALATGGLVGAALGNPLTSGAAESATTSTTAPTTNDGRHQGGPRGHGGMVDLAVAAKALGMSEADLKTALEDGKSLADIAKDKGVDKAKVIDALVAEAKSHLAEAVTEGHLTQAQADERAKDLEARITDRVDGKAPTGPMGEGHGGPMGEGGRGGN